MEATLDRRTAMEEAFDSAEADAKGETYVPPVHEEPPKEEVTADVEAEAETKAAEVAKPKDRPRTRGVPPDERVKSETENEKPEVTAKATSNLDKAPVSWGPQRNDLWAKVPSDIRAIVNKRETEIQQGMSQAGRIKQIAEEYHQVIMPFENVIRSMNTTPREAITNVMQTATALIVGTQEQKCAVITEMVQRYGVDLPALDKMLTAALAKGDGRLTHIGGQPVQQQQLDPRLQSLFAMEQRLRAADGQRHERMTQEAAAAINSVADKPYYEDVKLDMADIMEISANRGHIMTIEQAYEKACQLNPEVSKLVAKNFATPINAVARARKASSTVKGSPGGAIANGRMDRRAALAAAWDGQ